MPKGYSFGPGPTRYEHSDLISRIDRLEDRLDDLTKSVEALQSRVSWLVAVAGLGCAVITFLASVIVYHIQKGAHL